MAASTAEGNKPSEGSLTKKDEPTNDSQETPHQRLDLTLAEEKSSPPQGKELTVRVSTGVTSAKEGTTDTRGAFNAGDSHGTKEGEGKDSSSSIRRIKRLPSGNSLPSVSADGGTSSKPHTTTSISASHIPYQRYQSCVCLPLPAGEGDVVEELEKSVETIPPLDLWEDEELHRQFCEAVFNIGVSHATPSILRHGMQFQPPGLTTDRAKSHLQKFRNVIKKERNAFLHDYEKFVGFLELADKESGEYGMIRLETLLGGKAVAHASHCIMKEASQARTSSKKPFDSSLHNVFSTVMTEDGYGAGRIPMVQLTKEEAVTALGTSITYLQNLLMYMNRYLQEERQNCTKRLEKLLHGAGDQAKTEHQRQGSNATSTIATNNKDMAPPPTKDSSKTELDKNVYQGTSLATVAASPRIVDMVPKAKKPPRTGSFSSSSSSSSSSGGFGEPLNVSDTRPGDGEVLDNIATLGKMLVKKHKREAPTINNYSLERENTRKRTKLAEQVLLDFGEMASLSSKKRTQKKGFQQRTTTNAGSTTEGVQRGPGEFLQGDTHDATYAKLSSKYSSNQSIDRSIMRGLWDDSASKAAGSSSILGGAGGNFDSSNSVGASLRRWRKQMQRANASADSLGNSKGLSKPAWQKSHNNDRESYFDDSSIESEDDDNQNIEQYMNAITELKVSMANKQDEVNNPVNLLRWGDNDSLGSDDSSIWGGSFDNMVPPKMGTTNNSNNKQQQDLSRPSMISIPQHVPAVIPTTTARSLKDLPYGQQQAQDPAMLSQYRHERDLSTMSFQQMMSTLFPGMGDASGDGMLASSGGVSVASVGSTRSLLTRNSMVTHQQPQWNLPHKDSFHGTTNSLRGGSSNNYVPSPIMNQQPNFTFGQSAHGTSLPQAFTGMDFSHSTPSATYVNQGFNTSTMNPSGNPNFGDLPLDFLRYAGLLGSNNSTASSQGNGGS